MNPKEIREGLDSGDIAPEEAAVLFQQLEKKKPTQIIPWKSLETLIEYSPERVARNFETRKGLEETARHGVGLIAYGLIGLVDGVIEAACYGVAEIAEDATFLASYTLRRLKEGWERGKT